jgi:hypothetical protein
MTKSPTDQTPTTTTSTSYQQVRLPQQPPHGPNFRERSDGLSRVRLASTAGFLALGLCILWVLRPTGLPSRDTVLLVKQPETHTQGIRLPPVNRFQYPYPETESRTQYATETCDRTVAKLVTLYNRAVSSQDYNVIEKSCEEYGHLFSIAAATHNPAWTTQDYWHVYPICLSETTPSPNPQILQQVQISGSNFVGVPTPDGFLYCGGLVRQKYDFSIAHDEAEKKNISRSTGMSCGFHVVQALSLTVDNNGQGKIRSFTNLYDTLAVEHRTQACVANLTG